jgi:hypothetical protein
VVDFRHVKQCANAFNQAVELLVKMCDELEAEKYDDSSKPWFAISRGEKPWYIDVDWLGKIYRLQVAAEFEHGRESMRIKDLSLSVGILAGPRQSLSITPVSAAKFQINVRQQYVIYKTESSESETIYPRESAAELFFAMTGHPLDMF